MMPVAKRRLFFREGTGFKEATMLAEYKTDRKPNRDMFVRKGNLIRIEFNRLHRNKSTSTMFPIMSMSMRSAYIGNGRANLDRVIGAL